MKVLCIIQARMTSMRFPKKVLFKLGNITLLDWVYLRVVKTKLIDEVVIATTNEKEDDLILEHCKINNYKCFRGDKLNVLKRFYNCTIQHSGEIIVRITADDPFKDEKLISFAIKELVDKNLDYFSNTIYPTYPEGFDVEVFTKNSLFKAFKSAKKSSELEHVTPYIWKNPKIFKIANFKYKENLSKWRLTVDYKEDLKLIKKIINIVQDDIYCDYEKIIGLIKSDKNLLNLCKNSSHPRNEGFTKSEKEEIKNG